MDKTNKLMSIRKITSWERSVVFTNKEAATECWKKMIVWVPVILNSYMYGYALKFYIRSDTPTKEIKKILKEYENEWEDIDDCFRYL